ncbi:MAG: excinuclease ABC subunit UvrA [Dysgonamonadaceae bacterium]|jgi:excinuclease ABC subunit A|nr:excinuclease ABC subunit UvrA [Dysgonamonadaceae bacterium]
MKQKTSEPAFNGKSIDIEGARVHNLKNISVSIPRNKFTVITGLSGSGKSSLAFDTVFAEGQRRYVETFSAYARSFLGNMERPDVDKITGLSPVISIEQKTTNRSPRSTVGTTTEIYDFLRLLYARAGDAYSYLTGEKMIKYTENQILDLITEQYKGKKVYLLSPVVQNRKGHYKETFEKLRKKGYLNVRVDGELKELVPGMKLDRYKNHSIEIIINKLIVTGEAGKKIQDSLAIALREGNGLVMVLDLESGKIRYFSRKLMCPSTGLSYKDPAPHNFSFNSPHGACPKCKGIGTIDRIDRNKIIPNPELSTAQGGIVPLGKYRNILIFWQVEAILNKYGTDMKTPLKDVPEDALSEIMNGTEDRLPIKNELVKDSGYFLRFEGVDKYIALQQEGDASHSAQKWAGQFVRVCPCPECNGKRLNREALHYFVDGKNIAEIAALDIGELAAWLNELESRLSKQQQQIAVEILKEIRTRIRFLLDVGLEYLSLDRSSASLSGGESQRIRLATQIGSQLVNVLYILDEPSIGLHQKDNMRLIRSLKQLRDSGNSVIVVEHDKDMMLHADYIVDLGPKAGKLGGEIVFAGTAGELLHADTLTAAYLTGKKNIPVPENRRSGSGNEIVLKGACGNNLRNVEIRLPLGRFICVTGVSGSGKSSLINETLQPIISQKLYHSLQDPLPYASVEGLENIDKVINVDQSPIGRTPRSNPVTYTGIFSDIRNLFVGLPESKIRGYKPGRFSFNVKGGRCETCSGNGYRTIEMNFLPDVFVPCEDCRGKRYNRETLEVRFRGKSIADVLDMTINQAVGFFENVPQIYGKVKVLQEVGLGYVRLGQSSTTLSGGESQRVKLAAELAKRDTGRTLYILDEPTTGLHFDDIRVLLEVLNRLVDKGNTMIVIEHNLDVIKCADHLIDMGPGGGKGGGTVLFAGTPEELIESGKGYTAGFLQMEIARTKPECNSPSVS